MTAIDATQMIGDDLTAAAPPAAKVPWRRALVRTLLYGRNVDRAAKTRARLGLAIVVFALGYTCLLYTSPSPRDGLLSRMPSSA